MSIEPSRSAAPHVAVLGSGPSGFYAAQMLRKQWPSAEITIFDRLPVPFGLLRYGVAPDHQHTKQLTHQFSRVLQDAGTRFAGNVDVGETVTLEELRQNYHVVVLAAGLSADRRLGIPGDATPGVYGAGQFMRWLNAHPDEEHFQPTLGDRTVVVGTGNVAIDVLRMLINDDRQFANSDVHEPALAALSLSRPRRIHVVGRSDAGHAKFDAAMIRELAELTDVAYTVDTLDTAEPDRDSAAKLEALRGLAERDVRDARIAVSFHFGWSPQAVVGSAQTTGITFVGRDGETELVLETDSVITAIGFEVDAASALASYSAGEPALDLDRVRLGEGLYSCGWFRRGASGSIATNRACAKSVVGQIAADFDLTALPPRRGYEGLPVEARARAVGADGWQRIDAFEVADRGDSRVRRKIGSYPALLLAARSNKF